MEQILNELNKVKEHAFALSEEDVPIGERMRKLEQLEENLRTIPEEVDKARYFLCDLWSHLSSQIED